LTTTSDAVTRSVTVRIFGGRCSQPKHCISPRGALTGTITAGPRRIADVGEAFAIKAAGTVKPFGPATAVGTAYGLGNVRQGVEQMTLTLGSRRGRIVISAVTAIVPSFSHP
jgi:hypothetical protein